MPKLRQCDDVEITLNHHNPVGLTNALLGLVQTVKRRTLMKQRRLARVQILRHALIHHPAAEANDLARRLTMGNITRAKNFS